MAFMTEAHGRYEIKSGPLAGAWAANAIRHKTVVAKATGVTREEAIANLKDELDRMEQLDLSQRDTEGAPPASVYERAFGHLLPDMPDSYIAMLRAHLAAPTISSRLRSWRKPPAIPVTKEPTSTTAS